MLDWTENRPFVHGLQLALLFPDALIGLCFTAYPAFNLDNTWNIGAK